MEKATFVAGIAFASIAFLQANTLVEVKHSERVLCYISDDYR